MSALANCRVELGWTQIAEDYRAVTREHAEPIVQGCSACGAASWPPRLRCPCGSSDLRWFPAGRTGRLVSTVGVKLTVDEAPDHWVPRRLIPRLPYTTVIVELDAWPSVRMAVLSDGLSLTEAATGSTVMLSTELEGELVTLVGQAAEG